MENFKLWSESNPEALGEISPKCDISLSGYGATLSEVNSYLGVLQLQKIEELSQR